MLGVIPARYASTRFPGKPLALIADQTLIQRVWNQAIQAKLLDDLLVATDDRRIAEHVQAFGGRCEMTSTEHTSGTDRLGEVARRNPHDYYVNIQGDEPLLDPLALNQLIARTTSAAAAMSTLVSPLDSADSAAITDPNIVKAVRDELGYAIYFSRSPIPYPRNRGAAQYLKHIGIYMYSRETLAVLSQLAPTMLERAESLEQLRALGHGIRILAVECEYNPLSVDTPADAAAVERRLAALADQAAR